MPKTNSVEQVLGEARGQLVAAGLENAALDARLLLQAAAGLAHETLIASPDIKLTDVQIKGFTKFIARRLAHEPVARILGEREFYGRAFKVTPAVLDPRADTEAVVDLVLSLRSGHARILDIGTGSGAIAVTLLAERPLWNGVASDISATALDVAELNSQSIGVSERLHLNHGAWFDGVEGHFDIIVSNPPYINHDEIEQLSVDVKGFDPHLALDGGADGLAAYRAIAQAAAKYLAVGGLLAVEIGAGQAADVTAIFNGRDFSLIAQRADLGGHKRALAFEL